MPFSSMAIVITKHARTLKLPNRPRQEAKLLPPTRMSTKSLHLKDFSAGWRGADQEENCGISQGYGHCQSTRVCPSPTKENS
mmetsp:Transcript_58460/g.124027  ORF Transcript_58460/g.124027 Transcript_58460/m.124027 type:complete len:82 (+) Transcript_58460:65-310(+)